MVGFKSFSDKGQIAVNDSGVTAIVGPNGCGKSNVSDAIAWVLGEQSAKSLRGEKMEDVIFNGSRNRAPMGMAEVSITLTDTNPVYVAPNGNGNGNGNGANGNGTNGNGANGNGLTHVAHEGPVPVPGPRDIVVQRRLYRNGESLYLIDGKPCRLRDVHDMFLGTGLGPNSYAIIEQGRVGQLLSSKPMDRRALIEEAAGVTKFKAKRKLAESRLEAARLNLSRVNDILAEVDRQRNSLKRQAGKARRYIELRDRMREILSAVFSTRADMLMRQQETCETALASIGDEGRKLEADIERLNALVRQHRADVETHENSLIATRTRHAEAELEYGKVVGRIERLEDQIRLLEERKIALSEESARISEELTRNMADHNIRVASLEELDQTKFGIVQSLDLVKAEITLRTAERQAEEHSIEQLRRQQMELVAAEARCRNEITSRGELIQRLIMQIERLEREATEVHELIERIRQQLTAAQDEHLEHQSGMSQLRTRLAETEQECIRLKNLHVESVLTTAAAKSNQDAIRNRLQTIGDLAISRAYSTESVQQFFNHVRGSGWQPLGMLADFMEVEPNYESVVEAYLRYELQYVVVQNRSDAERALGIVRNITKGRLECLVLNGDNSSYSPDSAESIPGATPMASVIRFNERVRHFASRLRDAYIVDSLADAWELSGRYPHCRFVAKSGEVVQGYVVGWGQQDELGPLALKREIRELDRRAEAAERETTNAEEEMARLLDLFGESESLKARLTSELQEIEKTILTMDHRVRTLTTDLSHAESRWTVARAEIGRFAAERVELETALRDAEVQLAGLAESKSVMDVEIAAHTARNESLRVVIENEQRTLSEIQSQLAVLEERRSTAVRELNALLTQSSELEERARRAVQQIAEANHQQSETRVSIESLGETRNQLVVERDQLSAVIVEMAARLDELRLSLKEAEFDWDQTRADLDTWKDRHTALEIEKTQVDSDLKHLASTCWSELNETIESVCLRIFEPLSAEDLDLREQEYKEVREKMDSMGAVNMMAVDEYAEAEQRFEFLGGQRQDLLDSIQDTSQAIEEIDSVCRKQFKEAFEAVNTGFTEAFVHLFGGGHGELRLLEGTEESDAGVEIVAQPPGKKLQNVLLLSGGEKALTALALLIALFRYRPSPFCVLDEVDAPLDEANVDRFAAMVKDMSRTTQFIVITHSKRTMEVASMLYGVTMEEPGISKVVSVRLNESPVKAAAS
jgi:chromosome segregation protein